jgi:hypothetical protein
MKNRIWGPQAILAAFAVIAVMLGLSPGIASASVARPASSATATTVTKIHKTTCTRTTLSVRYDGAKKVACYTGQGFLKVALPAATQATAGSSGGFLFLRYGGVTRLMVFFPRERLPLAGRPEVTGIALFSLRVVSPGADSSHQGTQTPGTVAFTVDVGGNNATLTAASSVDAALINYAIAASVVPAAGGHCSASPWYEPWKWYCEWTFSHSQSVAIVRAAIGGGKAAVVTVCTGLLHRYLGPVAVGVCAFFSELYNVMKHFKLAKNQCIAFKIYIAPPRGGIGIVRC